jgi:hypothetical protein
MVAAVVASVVAAVSVAPAWLAVASWVMGFPWSCVSWWTVAIDGGD